MLTWLSCIAHRVVVAISMVFDTIARHLVQTGKMMKAMPEPRQRRIVMIVEEGISAVKGA